MSAQPHLKDKLITAVRFTLGQSTLGHVAIAQDQDGIRAILLGEDPFELTQAILNCFPGAQQDQGQLEVVLAQVIEAIEQGKNVDLPLAMEGTDFQKRVWQALRQIPCGQTATYSQVADKIGAAGSARAVARACASNVIALAIPCHRVVRSDGDISGYRWGVERKRELLWREALGRS